MKHYFLMIAGLRPNFLYRRRVGLEAIPHLQALGTRVAAWITTMNWETQNSQKTGPFSFWEQGFFQSMTDFETEDFSHKMEVFENIICENKTTRKKIWGL